MWALVLRASVALSFAVLNADGHVDRIQGQQGHVAVGALGSLQALVDQKHAEPNHKAIGIIRAEHHLGRLSHARHSVYTQVGSLATDRWDAVQAPTTEETTGASTTSAAVTSSDTTSAAFATTTSAVAAASATTTAEAAAVTSSDTLAVTTTEAAAVTSSDTLAVTVSPTVVEAGATVAPTVAQASAPVVETATIGPTVLDPGATASPMMYLTATTLSPTGANATGDVIAYDLVKSGHHVPMVVTAALLLFAAALYFRLEPDKAEEVKNCSSKPFTWTARVLALLLAGVLAVYSLPEVGYFFSCFWNSIQGLLTVSGLVLASVPQALKLFDITFPLDGLGLLKSAQVLGAAGANGVATALFTSEDCDSLFLSLSIFVLIDAALFGWAFKNLEFGMNPLN